MRSSSFATRLVADVGGEDVDAALIALGDLLDQALRVRIGAAPASQHDVAGPELGQIRRCVQADRAQPAGDQIGPIGPRLQRIRDLHHDFSDVPCLLHAAERGPRFGERVDLGGQWRPLALAQPLRHLGQQATNTLRLLEGHRVQRHDLVGDVGADLRHLCVSPDVAFGDLGEPAVPRGGPHGRLEEAFVRQAVEHHVDAGTVSVGKDLVGEIRCTRVIHVLHT